MSEAKRKRPPGFRTRAKRSRLAGLTKRRFQWLLLRPGIGVEKVDARRARRPAASRAGASRRRHEQPKIAEAAASASAAISLAMPLTKGSTPMKPVSGCVAASCSRCSPPPKPISSRTSSTRHARTAAVRSAGAAARSGRRRSCGRRLRQRVRLAAGRRVLPLAAGRRTPRVARLLRRARRRHCPRLPAQAATAVLERLGQVGLLPGEGAVAAGLAAEMAVGGASARRSACSGRDAGGCRAATGP